jgi:hypothetical protein
MLQDDIAAFDTMRDELERKHMGQWVIFQNCELAGTFSTFEEAAEVAVAKYGRGPYLLRQIGAPPVTLPASVMYRPV